jgi:hypothetical protein
MVDVKGLVEAVNAARRPRSDGGAQFFQTQRTGVHSGSWSNRSF